MNSCWLVMMVAHVYCHNLLCNVAAWDTRTVAQSPLVVRDKKKKEQSAEKNVTAGRLQMGLEVISPSNWSQTGVKLELFLACSLQNAKLFKLNW